MNIENIYACIFLIIGQYNENSRESIVNYLVSLITIMEIFTTTTITTMTMVVIQRTQMMKELLLQAQQSQTTEGPCQMTVMIKTTEESDLSQQNQPTRSRRAKVN